MVIEKVIQRVTEVVVVTAYSAFIGSLAYVVFDSEKRAKESVKLADKREKVGLPRYCTEKEEEKKNSK